MLGARLIVIPKMQVPNSNASRRFYRPERREIVIPNAVRISIFSRRHLQAAPSKTADPSLPLSGILVMTTQKSRARVAVRDLYVVSRLGDALPQFFGNHHRAMAAARAAEADGQVALP